MSSITINATMEVIYYTISVIGSFKIIKDIFTLNEKTTYDISEEDYFGDIELEDEDFDEDGYPKASFYYDKEMYMSNGDYAGMVDQKIIESRKC